MEIKILPKSVQDLLRTGTTIKSASHCTTQLVLNSLDAKSTSIAIRVNLITHNIQIIDNGKGISKHNFELIGQRYATSKYLSTKELKDNPYIFGQRGEALASIIKISKTVKITSKTADSSETYMKTFENGKSLGISDTFERASKGTTVLIEDFMYNLPVRKSHMKINNCIEEIKNEIEAIALIHSDISFSLRHDPSGEIIFQTYKTKYIYETTTHLYGNEFTKQLRKIRFANDKFKISGMISVVGHGHKRIQLVYVNKRHLKKSKIHSLVNSLIRKSKILKNNSSPTLKHKYGVYIINLNCSRSEYDVVDFNNVLIEFRNCDDILTCVEQAVKEFLEKENLVEKPKEITTNDFQVGTPALQEPIQVRTSQYDGVIRGVSVKRKQSKPEDEIESKVSVITIEDSDNVSARREKEDNETIPQEKKPRKTTKEAKGKLTGAENSVSANDTYDSEKPLQVAKKATKQIVKEIIAKAQEQKKTKYYNSLKVETHSNTKEKHFDNDIRVLRSLASAQDIILDMFLKSTAVFKTDEDLKEEFATNNKENIDEPVDEIANLVKQSNTGNISNSAKPQNNISNLNGEGNSEPISGKQITNLDKDNLKLVDKKAISSFNDEINVISDSNPDNQINYRQISKNQTTNLVKQDIFTQISRNQIKNVNPARPIQVSKAIQVSASKIPELNWNPDVRKIDPFQLFNKRKPSSKCPVTLNTKIHPNSNLHLNQNIVRRENPRKQLKVIRNQHSNMKQKIENRRINNEVLKKFELTNRNDNYKLNFKVKKVLTYKDIFKNNEKPFTRKPLREKNYVQASYENYKRIKYGVEGHKIPIVTRFNYRLISSSSSTFAHRDLTSFKYNYKYTVKKTQKFVHSSNFIKPAINDKEKRFKLKSSLNPREILHAKSMIKTWYDFNKNSNQCRQNFRDTKYSFGKTFCAKKNKVFRTKKLPYIRPSITNVDYTDIFSEDNNYRGNVLKPNNGLRMESLKLMKENNFDPYFNVQKEIYSFENNNKQNKGDNILKPNHFDFQNCFKKPKSPKSRYIPCNKNMVEPNVLYKENEVDKILEPNQFDLQNCFKNSKSPKPIYIPRSKNVVEPNTLYNNMTMSQSFDITFATILPENDALSVCDNQKYRSEIVEILAPRNCESISQINDGKSDSNYQNPYTKKTDYQQCNNLAKSPITVRNKEKQNYQNIRPQSFENNYSLEEMNFRDIPQASEDAYIPFRTNPHLNEYMAEKTKHVSTNIQPQDYISINKYSDENKQCILTYPQHQNNEIFNRFHSENIHNTTSNIQPQELEHNNKSPAEKTKQLKSHLQPVYYEKPLNMQQRKRPFLDESLIYPYKSPSLHLKNHDVQLQSHDKCLNTPAGNTESLNITFSPKICILEDVDKNNYNNRELSNMQTRKSNINEIVAETPVYKMGEYVSSYNNSSSKNEDIISNSPSGNNLPSCRPIRNLSHCIASNNNNEQNIINYPNMDVPTRKLSQNVSHRTNYNTRQDLNNISCSKDISKHVSPDVIAMPSRNFNGNQLNLNTKNSEHFHIVPNTKEVINNNNNNLDIYSHSVVDLTSSVNDAEPDKVKNCNIDPNGGQDLNRIDVLSNSRRSPEGLTCIAISDTTVNRRSGTSKTITSTHSNKNLKRINVLSNRRRSPEGPPIVISDTTLNKHSGTPKSITSKHSNKNLELDASKFDTKNVEISTVNQQNNTDDSKNKSVVEKILLDFESLCNSDSEKKVENQFTTSGKNNIEVTKKHFHIDKNTSVTESVLMDLQNIMNSTDTEINLNTRATIPEKNNSQISTEYLKFSYDPVDIAKNNMDAENDPDDFDITFEFDPDFLPGSKYGTFEENLICESSTNTENCLNNIDSKKEEKISNKTVKVLNCEHKSNIENLSSSCLTNMVPDSNENKIEIGKSFNTETIANNINDINSRNNESLKLEFVKNSDDKAMTENPNLETPKNTRSFPRPSFLPKGMSPILYSVSTAPITELSPTSKKKLHKIMAKSKHDDLQTVKWMNYFRTKDAKTFFADLYTDKRNYEKSIPNLNAKMVPKKLMAGLNNFTFSKECFDRLTVISQWDNKFIVTKVLIGENKYKLVLFDQHAVHERIRLENLLKEYKVNQYPNLKSTKCKEIKLKLDEIDIRMLKNYKLNFESWGLIYNIKNKQTAIFTKIPICWESKDERINTDSTNIQHLIKDLIAEVSNWLRNTGKINIVIPHVILNSIKTEACRGAVKFGDALTKDKCEEFVKQLSFCDLPFQCAHGRPTLVPIYNLNELNTSMKTREVRWNKLKIGINKHT